MNTNLAVSIAPGKDKYRLIGPIYDFLSNLYSGRSIHEAKCAMLGAEHLKAGDKVLFAGVGHGRDAIFAAERGAEVTVIDLSETMLRKFRESLERQGKTHLNIRQIQGDIFAFDELDRYDMVVGNFFLNVFPKPMMVEVLQHLIRLTRQGGSVVIGDFAFPKGNLLARSFKQAYWYVAVSLFWLTAGNAVHEIYNYPEHMRRLGLTVQAPRYFRLLGMDCYWSVLGRKSV